MKRILLGLLLGAVLAGSPAHAVVVNPETQMLSFRAAVSNVLFVATNGVASPDKKVVTALKKALGSIDKTAFTNVPADTKTLSTVVGSLSRSAASNDLNTAFTDVLNYFYFLALDHAENSSNQLAGAFPSGTKTAAGRTLAQVYGYLDDPATNVSLWAKAIANASKKLIVVDKLVDKALDAPAPPNGFTAKITASNEGSFSYKPIVQSVQAAYDSTTKILNITSTEVKISGGLSGTVQTRGIGFLLNVPGDGTYTYNLATDPNVLAYYQVTRTKVTGGAPLYAEVYEDNSGTLVIKMNTSTKTVSGTFNFSGPGSNDSSRSVTAEGSFTITYLP